MAHSKVQGRRNKSVPGRGCCYPKRGKREMMGVQQSRGKAMKDLTWGYRMPQGQLYIQIKQIDERGHII